MKVTVEPAYLLFAAYSVTAKLTLNSVPEYDVANGAIESIPYVETGPSINVSYN